MRTSISGTTTATRPPRSRPLAVLGAGVAVLGMLVTATPAAADPAGSFADAKVTMSCDAATADGSVVELFVEADPQGTVRESYLEVIGQDGEHLALGTPVHTALGGGVVEVTHDLADSEGASLGTAHLRGTLTAGEPVLSRDTWRDNGGQWHSVMLVTPYAVSWDTIEVGSFDLDGLDCTSRQVDYETRWSEPHRRVFSGQEVTPAEGCAVAPMTHLSVGLLPDNVEVSFGTGDGYGLTVLDGTAGTLSGRTYWFDLEGEHLGATEATGSFDQTGRVRNDSAPSKTSNVVSHTTPYALTFDLRTPDGRQITNDCGVDVTRTRWIGVTPNE